MRVLGIETSCDETSASVVLGPSKVLSNIVASSLDKHAVYGGVIPEIASRAHLECITAVVDEAMKRAGVKPKMLDAIAVTQGPGLVGSLLVGLSFAQSLSLAWKLPILGINHVRAHLYAAFIDNKISYPFAGLVVSGGHTSLYKVKRLGSEEVLGSTRDDAAGEAFDKVAKILGLSYPGGPIIEKMAKSGNSKAFSFRCDCGSGLDFSFSGIKTAVLYKTRELEKLTGKLSEKVIFDICASFQNAVVSDLVNKSMKAVHKIKAKSLVVGGGVAFNEYLRQKLSEAANANGIKLYVAAKPYCLDNAAMVASLGARLISLKGVKRVLHFDPLAG